MAARAPFAVEPPDAAEVDLFQVRMGDRSFAVVSFPVPARTPAPLSAAEADVLELLLAGGSNREIAQARGTCERTVANQVASLFRKLGVGSRSELAAHAAWFAPELAGRGADR